MNKASPRFNAPNWIQKISYIGNVILMHPNEDRQIFFTKKDATNDATNRWIFWRFFGVQK
jgi:hypothetical protein